MMQYIPQLYSNHSFTPSRQCTCCDYLYTIWSYSLSSLLPQVLCLSKVPLISFYFDDSAFFHVMSIFHGTLQGSIASFSLGQDMGQLSVNMVYALGLGGMSGWWSGAVSALWNLHSIVVSFFGPAIKEVSKSQNQHSQMDCSHGTFRTPHPDSMS